MRLRFSATWRNRSEAGDRLIIVNLGRQLLFSPCAEPLLAPVAGGRWKLIWSSEDPAYGGDGTPAAEDAQCWQVPAHAAIVLAAEPGGPRRPALPGQNDESA